MSRKSIISIALVVLFSALSAFLLCSLYLRLSMNLVQNGNWKSSKPYLAKGVVHATDFAFSRLPLSEEQLDLGSWQGHNEITSQVEFFPKEITFKFKIEAGRYLAFEFNRQANSFSGFLLSASKHYESKYFVADNSGKFLSSTPIELTGLTQDFWHKATVVFESTKTILQIDDSEIFTAPSAVQNQKIGFRSSHGPVQIDDIHVISTNGNHWLEDFSAGPFPLLLLLTFFLFLILLLTVAYQVKRNLAVPLSFGFLCCIFFYDLADANIFSRQYNNYTNLVNAIIPPKATDFKNNFQYLPEVHAKLSETYFSEFNEPSYKLLFLGSSQTWGAGALEEKDSLTNQFAARLAGNTNFKNVRVYNAAVSGFNASLAWKYFTTFGSKLPDMIVINLSNNDTYTADLRNHLKDFIHFCRRRNIEIILVQEPNFVEQVGPHLVANHKEIEILGQQYGLKVVKLHDHLLNLRETGFLWWDLVHLTSYGQQVAGVYIADQVSPLLEKRLKHNKK